MGVMIQAGEEAQTTVQCGTTGPATRLCALLLYRKSFVQKGFCTGPLCRRRLSWQGSLYDLIRICCLSSFSLFFFPLLPFSKSWYMWSSAAALLRVLDRCHGWCPAGNCWMSVAGKRRLCCVTSCVSITPRIVQSRNIEIKN